MFDSTWRLRAMLPDVNVIPQNDDLTLVQSFEWTHMVKKKTQSTVLYKTDYGEYYIAKCEDKLLELAKRKKRHS
jgi:hypothetical protein